MHVLSLYISTIRLIVNYLAITREKINTWRAEADKKGREAVIPVPATLLDAVRDFRRRLSVLGGWLFAAELKPEQPMDRHLFDKWLSVAERAKLTGGFWHPYRRKWATERKHLSLKDVAAAGGWKDVETLTTCYQQPDTDTLLAVAEAARGGGGNVANAVRNRPPTDPRIPRAKTRRPATPCRACASTVGTAGFEPATP